MPRQYACKPSKNKHFILKKIDEDQFVGIMGKFFLILGPNSGGWIPLPHFFRLEGAAHQYREEDAGGGFDEAEEDADPVQPQPDRQHRTRQRAGKVDVGEPELGAGQGRGHAGQRTRVRPPGDPREPCQKGRGLRPRPSEIFDGCRQGPSTRCQAESSAKSRGTAPTISCRRPRECGIGGC